MFSADKILGLEVNGLGVEIVIVLSFFAAGIYWALGSETGDTIISGSESDNGSGDGGD